MIIRNMTLEELKAILEKCLNEIVFEYNNKPSGIDITVNESIPNFQVWHGEMIKEYKSIEDVLTDKFYSGKSLSEIVGMVEFEII